MSPDTIGLVVGAAFVVPTIYLFKMRGFEPWAWPVFLVSLPVWYMLFGLLAMDGEAIFKELLYGLPYIATGLITWRVRTPATGYLLAAGWMSHGLYDIYHDALFVNPGVFAWYPAFCAVVDLVAGGYLLFRARRAR